MAAMYSYMVNNTTCVVGCVAHHAEVGSLVAVLLLVEDDGVPIRKPETIRHDEIFMSSVLNTFEKPHLTKQGIRNS